MSQRVNEVMGSRVRGVMKSVQYLCPHCRGRLEDASLERYDCLDCERSFPIVHGIPDLRPVRSSAIHGASTGSNESLFNKPDDEVATLVAHFEEASLEELIRIRLSNARMPVDVAELHLCHELVGNERGAERVEQILRFEGVQGVDRSGVALDIGCGMGGMVHALARRFAWAVGIDVAMADLIIAQKRCREAGLNNVTFICASAEALPFAEGAFALINATDVVEHIPQQRLFLSEGYRVLQPDGYFCFNSPNRYNIFGPEPHVNLWGVGFLPRRWMPAYVRLLKGMDYQGKRLLSCRELRHLLQQTPGLRHRILGTALRASSARKGWRHRLAFRFPFLVRAANRFLKPFVPQYEVVVYKPH